MATPRIKPIFSQAPASYDNFAIGQSVRRARKSAKMKQNVLAKLMGISPSYLCELERGTRNWTAELIRSVNDQIEKPSVKGIAK